MSTPPPPPHSTSKSTPNFTGKSTPIPHPHSTSKSAPHSTNKSTPPPASAILCQPPAISHNPHSTSGSFHVKSNLVSLKFNETSCRCSTWLGKTPHQVLGPHLFCLQFYGNLKILAYRVVFKMGNTRTQVLFATLYCEVKVCHFDLSYIIVRYRDQGNYRL